MDSIYKHYLDQYLDPSKIHQYYEDICKNLDDSTAEYKKIIKDLESKPLIWGYLYCDYITKIKEFIQFNKDFKRDLLKVLEENFNIKVEYKKDAENVK